MANRIDAGVQPTAHSAVQAMLVRAQQVADHTGKAIGVRYDLGSDEISLVEITPDVAKKLSFLRIVAPAGIAGPGEKPAVAAGNSASPDVKAAGAV